MSEEVVFLNVDTQVGFVSENGNLPVPEAESIRGNLARLTRLAEIGDYPRVNTKDYHTPDDDEIVSDPDDADFVSTYPEHCLRGTRDAEYIIETQPNRFEVIITQDFDMNEELVGSSDEFVVRKKSVQRL